MSETSVPTIAELGMYLISREPFFVPGMGCWVQATGLSGHDGYSNVQGRVVTESGPGASTGFSINHSAGTIIVDDRYTNVHAQAASTFEPPLLRYEPGYWNLWCYALQTRFWISVNPAGDPSSVTLVRPKILGEHVRRRRVLVEDLHDQEHGGLLTVGKNACWEVRAMQPIAPFEQDTPAGAYTLPVRKIAASREAAPKLFQRLNPLESGGSAIYLYLLRMLPLHQGGEMTFLDPYGREHHAQAMDGRDGNARIQFAY